MNNQGLPWVLGCHVEAQGKDFTLQVFVKALPIDADAGTREIHL